MVFGTLLGPEATGPGGAGTAVVVLVVSWVCLFLVSWLHRSCMFVCVGCVCGLGLLFENCIVDASILNFVYARNRLAWPALWGWLCWLCVIVKFLRAHGGCLGIRSRRRTWESAISLGELITEL